MMGREGNRVHGAFYTVPLRRPGHVGRHARTPAITGHRVARGFTGSIAAGLLLLTLFVLAMQLFDSGAGPGFPMVLAHVVAALLAVGCQAVADRTVGLPRAASMLGVLLVAAALLWFFWY